MKNKIIFFYFLIHPSSKPLKENLKNKKFRIIPFHCKEEIIMLLALNKIPYHCFSSFFALNKILPISLQIPLKSKTKTFRICKKCKTQINLLLIHPQSCSIFHSAAHFGGNPFHFLQFFSQIIGNFFIILLQMLLCV